MTTLFTTKSFGKTLRLTSKRFCGKSNGTASRSLFGSLRTIGNHVLCNSSTSLRLTWNDLTKLSQKAHSRFKGADRCWQAKKFTLIRLVLSLATRLACPSILKKRFVALLANGSNIGPIICPETLWSTSRQTTLGPAPASRIVRCGSNIQKLVPRPAETLRFYSDCVNIGL